jgi:hypothetical protein
MEDCMSQTDQKSLEKTLRKNSWKFLWRGLWGEQFSETDKVSFLKVMSMAKGGKRGFALLLFAYKVSFLRSAYRWFKK